MIKLSDETKAKLKKRVGFDPNKKCNGCGSGWNKKLVPDHIFFLCIKLICCIHDDEYDYGITKEDKQRIDKNFLRNLFMAINSINKWYYPTKLAKKQAIVYYKGVKCLGDEAFYSQEKKV